VHGKSSPVKKSGLTAAAAVDDVVLAAAVETAAAHNARAASPVVAQNAVMAAGVAEAVHAAVLQLKALRRTFTE
jgi:hypothetical protein